MAFPFSRTTPTVTLSPKRAALGFVFELIQVMALALAIIIPVRYFLIQPFYVKGASMEPNFFDHEYLIIDEISYRFRAPTRGEIFVLRYPNDHRQYFIKRVIGLPGETLEIAGGKVKIYTATSPNGVFLDETAYLEGEYTSTNHAVTLKKDEYYVLGDNRVASLDSRYFGPVKRDLIVGRVWVRGWPLDRWQMFKHPQYPKL